MRIISTGLRGWWLAPILGVASVAAAGDDLRLVEAVESRNGEAVRALLKQQVEVNTPQPDGATALHWAAHWDDLETADLLLRAGANVNAANDWGVRPLSLACSNANAAMVERLLKAGAAPNAPLLTGETALMTAARSGNPGVVRALLANGANVNARETKGQTALMWAAENRHPEVARTLLENGADVHARSTGGFTPLLFAARQGDLASAQVLLAAGANPNETATASQPRVPGSRPATADGSSPPLVVASASVEAITISGFRVVPRPSGHEAVALFLLENGADPNMADGRGLTALHAAVETGRLQLVNALLARGANPNARLVKEPPHGRGEILSRDGDVGATPFWLAARAGEVDIMQALVAGGADPNLGAADNTTPLMAATGLSQNIAARVRTISESQFLEAVKVAVELGADVNAANDGGETALHGAAGVGESTIIQFLADKGGNVDAEDEEGRTPLTVAERGGSYQESRKKGADLLRTLSGDAGSAAR